jgi:KaiC/GvpD/RAD55 family RecA-like ATPase
MNLRDIVDGAAPWTGEPPPDIDPARPLGGGLLDAGFWAGEARVTLELPYVVKGVVHRGQLVVVWGPPGSGKSFNVLEMLCCVGAGVPWRGRRTKRGAVLYVYAESAKAQIQNRIAALMRERRELRAADVLVVPLCLDLLQQSDGGDVDRVIDAAQQISRDRGEVAAIAIDTLAVTFGGGDENSGAAMGSYVRNIKRIIEATGAAAIIVHHCGKDEGRGMRGHSALLGALDAELAIEGTADERILRTGKVRDGDANTDLFAFRLRPVELGRDMDGDRVTTCVVDSLNEGDMRRIRDRGKKAELGKNQKTVLQAVETAGGRISRPKLVQKLKAKGMPRNRVQESIAALLQSGMLIAHNDTDPPEVSLPSDLPNDRPTVRPSGVYRHTGPDGRVSGCPNVSESDVSDASDASDASDVLHREEPHHMT